MPKHRTTIEGKAWRFGSNISTDDIISAAHLTSLSIDEIAPFAFENLRPEFAKNVKPNDVIVAEENLGIRSSRESAAAILRSLGVGAIIAASFARIFFRNAYNLGIPAVEFPAIAKDANLIKDGDRIRIDLKKGTLFNHRTGQTHQITKVPPFLLQYIEVGGAIPLLKQKLKTI